MKTKFGTTTLSKKYLLLIILLLSIIRLPANNPDSLFSSLDTMNIYRKIMKVAYKRKVTRLLYGGIFVDPRSPRYVKPLVHKQKEEDPNLNFSGKIIRNIIIEVYDPFGYNINDSIQTELNTLQKLGNKYHITTRSRIIKNILLFKQNEILEPIKISESERLIRATGYITDARIVIENKSMNNQDSVDVRVIVHDKWNLDVPASIGTTSWSFKLRDRNLFGSGQRFEQYVKYNIHGDYQFSGRYDISNISNTFISSSVFYTTQKNLTQTGFSFDKPFYSTLAKWAWGVAAVKTWNTYMYTDSVEDVLKPLNLNYYNTDVWAARSMSIDQGKNINKRFNNIIFALRYAETNFQQRPSFSIDTNKLNANSHLYLSSVGFSQRKYYKDQYIFRFGAAEDIPEGFVVQFLYGMFYKEQSPVRYYTGYDVSYGKHIDKLGYFSAYNIYGTFFNKWEANNSTFNAGLTYFTDLLKSNNWYFRQFVYLKYINGLNKPVYEKITLRPDELYGFNSGSLVGKNKLILNIEAVAYSPLNLIGFHFAPLLLAGYGMIGDDNYSLLKGRIYQSYAVGALIRNENLLTSSFEITFGAYPYLPDGDKHFFRLNPVTSFTVKFRSFAVTKPSVVLYE